MQKFQNGGQRRESFEYPTWESGGKAFAPAPEKKIAILRSKYTHFVYFLIDFCQFHSEVPA